MSFFLKKVVAMPSSDSEISKRLEKFFLTQFKSTFSALDSISPDSTEEVIPSLLYIANLKGIDCKDYLDKLQVEKLGDPDKISTFLPSFLSVIRMHQDQYLDILIHELQSLFSLKVQQFLGSYPQEEPRMNRLFPTLDCSSISILFEKYRQESKEVTNFLHELGFIAVVNDQIKQLRGIKGQLSNNPIIGFGGTLNYLPFKFQDSSLGKYLSPIEFVVVLGNSSVEPQIKMMNSRVRSLYELGLLNSSWNAREVERVLDGELESPLARHLPESNSAPLLPTSRALFHNVSISAEIAIAGPETPRKLGGFWLRGAQYTDTPSAYLLSLFEKGSLKVDLEGQKFSLVDEDISGSKSKGNLHPGYGPEDYLRPVIETVGVPPKQVKGRVRDEGDAVWISPQDQD